jgi:molybdopterin-guanine dinucleotide biosynthesis protein A
MRTGSCFGIVLAGGLSRRMGGGDKGLCKLGGESLLARVVAAMRPQCAGLVLSANGDPARFAAIGIPIVADSVQGFLGPLAGILASLDWIAAHLPDVECAISAPADTPFLPDDLTARLKTARAEHNAKIACARSGGRTHPLIALWPVAIRGDLRHALVVEERRKVADFLQTHRCATADWPAEPFDPFFNVNEPGDLAAAEFILSQRETHIA